MGQRFLDASNTDRSLIVASHPLRMHCGFRRTLRNTIPPTRLQRNHDYGLH